MSVLSLSPNWGEKSQSISILTFGWWNLVICYKALFYFLFIWSEWSQCGIVVKMFIWKQKYPWSTLCQGYFLIDFGASHSFSANQIHHNCGGEKWMYATLSSWIKIQKVKKLNWEVTLHNTSDTQKYWNWNYWCLNCEGENNFLVSKHSMSRNFITI